MFLSRSSCFNAYWFRGIPGLPGVKVFATSTGVVGEVDVRYEYVGSGVDEIEGIVVDVSVGLVVVVRLDASVELGSVEDLEHPNNDKVINKNNIGIDTFLNTAVFLSQCVYIILVDCPYRYNPFFE
jgi:hypothetical protein